MTGRWGSLLSRRVPARSGAGFAVAAEKARRSGQPSRAVQMCREGLEQFPGQLSARVTLGCALFDLGQDDEARVEFEQVLKRAPDNLAAIRGMAQLHDRVEGLPTTYEPVSDWPPRAEAIEEASADAARMSRQVATEPA